MQFPLSFLDISLWLAVTAIILLVTSELVSASQRRNNKIPINEQRLRNVALIIGVLFIVTVVIRVYEIIISTST